MFDGLCENVFMGAFLKWNQYSKPIVLDDEFENFMHAAECQAFGDLWRVLAGIRGLNDKHKHEANQTGYKRCHVFSQFFSLIRMSNPRLLLWWAMNQSVVNCGWGVGASALDINAY